MVGDGKLMLIYWVCFCNKVFIIDLILIIELKSIQKIIYSIF